ncbi:hypothetical protein [Methylomonas methanica]|uniref:Uncharacterized protein n=1 Tax=Methylomonas methanica TaxID=421 RepID=A0A177MNZ6_METMH|nr:hypothetical protein [Methylomonas methanica]OAI07114.1 hypothetical protein A1332_09575 [Methylomonas methanica]
MRQAVLREILCVDANRQIHIDIPADMGDQFEVIVMPVGTNSAIQLSEDEQLLLANYSAVIESNPEEDALWEKYVRS